MPIGKNALKRVSNNGYSNVASSAPDMENSVIEAEEQPKKTKEALSEKAAAKKSADKKPSAPKQEKKKSAATGSAEKKASAPKAVKEEARGDAEAYVNIGRDMPTYLL